MRAAVFALLLLASASMLLGQFGRIIYISPDEKLQAMVIPTKKLDGYFHESRVEVRSRSGDIISTNDHSSPDGQHGRGVLHATWSADSQFFVYSTSSSGGHSAWHFNTFVFVRKLSRFFQLDEVLGISIVDPDFTLSLHGIFHGRRMNDEGHYEDFEVPLSEVHWNQKT